MKLNSWMEREKLGNEAMGALIGVHPVSVSKYRQGKMVPRPGLMAKIIELTGGDVTANDFFAPHHQPTACNLAGVVA